MSRLPAPALLALGILLLSGCAETPSPPVLPATAIEAHGYACRRTDTRPTAKPEQHVTLRADDQHTGYQLQLGTQSDWRSLAMVTGSNGQVYADDAYAWRPDGTAGVLTDIKEVQTYNCVADDAARKPAK